MLPIVTLAVIGNATLSASRCGHKTWAQALQPGKALANLILAHGICRAKEREVNVGSNQLVVLVGRIVREVKRNRDARGLQLGKFTLGKAIVARMNHIKLLHVRKVKAIEDIARIATDTALVGAKKDTITINHSNACRTVLADELFAFGKLNVLILKTRNHMLSSSIITKDAHIRGARGSAFLGIYGKVHRIATRIHCVNMLIAVDDVVAKSQCAYVKRHDAAPLSYANGTTVATAVPPRIYASSSSSGSWSIILSAASWLKPKRSSRLAITVRPARLPAVMPGTESSTQQQRFAGSPSRSSACR